jgi:hypothetical protein
MNSRYLFQGRCLSSCPNKTVQFGSMSYGRQCLSCGSHCLVCSSSTICEICTDSKYFHKDDCLRECPTGTFADGEDAVGRTCQLCQDDCSLCSTASTCLSCTNGKYLHNAECLASCPEGSIPSGIGSVGLTCDDPDSCRFGFTLSDDSGSCEPNWPLWSGTACVLALVLLILFIFFMQRRALKSLLLALDTNKEKRIEAALKRAIRTRISTSNSTIRAARRQLKVLHDKYTDYEALLQILDRGMEFGDMKLVRGSWLMDTRNTRRLRRQQELPKEAFWSPNELRSQLTVVSIVAISYCWLHPVHPDPHGKHLRELQRAIHLRLQLRGPGQIQDLAIFLDYASLPQHADLC